MAANGDRELDIVLYGATGFVGQLTAAYLAEQADPRVRIALAGRSQAKLEQVRAELPSAAAAWPVIVADASDASALGELAARTKVVATTVGPYAAYGMPLASACAAAGTHYADLTGEVLFARASIDANQAAAEASGAKIVHSCGFDSIPSDLGVLLLAERATADGEGTLGETTLRVRSLRGGFSGGTFDSMRRQAITAGSDGAARRVVADSYGLSPDRSAEPPSRNRPARRPGLVGTAATYADRLPVRRDADGRWQAPFVMASYNTRVVRRSNALRDHAYGREFRYAEVTDCGSDLMAPVKASVLAGGLLGLAGGMSFGPTRRLLDRVLPSPGEGPSPEQQQNGRFVMDIETATTTGARYRARVAADKDPGYSGTAVMFGESALCLALDDLPSGGGVLTPAVAMGDALVDRLRAAGLTLEVTRRT